MNSFSTLSILQIILFPILYVFSFLYRALFLLDQKLTKKKKLPGAFVISVGNLSMGGTGKTPFSIFLAKLIHKKFPDQKIIILSRGYNAKGSLRGHRVGPHSTPMEAGDEPLLLKKHLPFAEVWIGKDRYSSYIHFREELRMRENSIVILDDGFQHHVLERDVDLVLLDSSKISKERFLIPAGNLREPISSLIRADQIIFSKYESSIEKIVQNIQNKFSKEILRFSLEPDKLLSPNLQSDSPKILSGKKVYAFTGIGNPEVFFSMIRKFEPLKLETRAFRDHHSYTIEDENVLNLIAKNFDFLVCTEKDLVKISNPPNQLRILLLKSKLDKEEKLISFLQEKISLKTF
ncbi:tetraacyldisaccharide 4'-kinase [Leptospira interrogans]|uniref:Tetraacyldisaccharide 4'-kinase n=1 Tax=Leptospira interrogans serovar Pomona TaxID=44276 RepID=A0AA40WCJ6_LEPIR|nr:MULTISPECIES: tetraacyldisaccharide 4'-kinase [Leptospira]EJO77542.1 tetraacyldisaccharide 4'-kinase [Leptospira interrogans serovar Pomona str. Kennewicki LC82-25]EKN97290.1 tetraacyldisaccharide 4'-kinase [Leptospira interrogans serovar Pomona str. Pomona]EKR35333.1 tetraacyldisaccharide 4'-kinase [Leptospira interrogans serovar Hebdomadis str. R499]EKR84792.1 tetraacyldisaccharide 4'-kinase [Leptospira interrogans str. UI 08452]EMF34015.1 tetraacyldisaccharide 4'-kinase [Leptospira inter